MSNESSPSLPQQNSLDEIFSSFASRVEKIDEAIDVHDHTSLVTARGNLAEIILELEQLHVDEIDVPVSAEEQNTDADNQSKRFLLTKEISNLLQQTRQLYQVLDITIDKTRSIQHSPQQDEPETVSSTVDDTPLAREEIAKLLLLVSRARGIGQLSDSQKSSLKLQVCARKSHLRDILRQQDITHIMAALRAAGGE